MPPSRNSPVAGNRSSTRNEEQGVDVCFELHPGEDLFDGVTFERFLDKLGGHKRCCINYDPSHFRLQALDYVGFIDVYHERIKAFHVKDAEFRPSPKQGVYSGFADWPHRAGRFRSLGDGDVDFGAIFSSLSVYGYDSWAVLEWECAIKDRDDGAREGAEFIKKHLIKVSEFELRRLHRPGGRPVRDQSHAWNQGERQASEWFRVRFANPCALA